MFEKKQLNFLLNLRCFSLKEAKIVEYVTGEM